MLVETYECEETSAETLDESGEALELINKLGLSGQKKLYEKNGDGISRNPYREMTDDEHFAFKVTCPVETELDKYSSSPIPLRVLQVAAHAKEISAFDKIVVWHPAGAITTDPVLVGNKRISYADHHYILARWGAALEEMPALMKAAKAKWKETTAALLTKIVGDATNDLRAVESDGVPTAKMVERMDRITYIGL